MICRENTRWDERQPSWNNESIPWCLIQLANETTLHLIVQWMMITSGFFIIRPPDCVSTSITTLPLVRGFIFILSNTNIFTVKSWQHSSFHWEPEKSRTPRSVGHQVVSLQNICVSHHLTAKMIRATEFRSKCGIQVMEAFRDEWHSLKVKSRKNSPIFFFFLPVISLSTLFKYNRYLEYISTFFYVFLQVFFK